MSPYADLASWVIKQAILDILKPPKITDKFVKNNDGEWEAVYDALSFLKDSESLSYWLAVGIFDEYSEGKPVNREYFMRLVNEERKSHKKRDKQNGRLLRKRKNGTM